MPRSLQDMLDNPVSAFELFPGLEKEVQKLVDHSAVRIKFWIISGVLANLVVLIGIGAPMIYYLGTMQAQVVASVATIADVTATLKSRGGWMQEREMWEIQAEAAMRAKGIEVPPRASYRREP